MKEQALQTDGILANERQCFEDPMESSEKWGCFEDPMESSEHPGKRAAVLRGSHGVKRAAWQTSGSASRIPIPFDAGRWTQSTHATRRKAAIKHFKGVQIEGWVKSTCFARRKAAIGYLKKHGWLW